MNISIPDTMKSEVEEVVANDGYGNLSAFSRDYLKQRQERNLEAIILESGESGDYTP